MEKKLTQEKLNAIVSSDRIQAQFKSAIKDNGGVFLSSIIELYNGDKSLQLCEPTLVVLEALKAATLNLPINKTLGQAYIIPYSKKYLDSKDNKWKYKKEPQFQIGFKGIIQLAMRTGQYKTINADVVYDGELNEVNKLTGEIRFNGKKKTDKIIGYFCYFELLNGFSKTLYITKEDMAKHACRFSASLKSKQITPETLLAQSLLPADPNNKEVGWLNNFDDMAIKTVITKLLSKYGYLSVQMQTAFAEPVVEEEQGQVQEKQEFTPYTEEEGKKGTKDDVPQTDTPPQQQEPQQNTLKKEVQKGTKEMKNGNTSFDENKLKEDTQEINDPPIDEDNDEEKPY
jgi:recombination protein RecT